MIQNSPVVLARRFPGPFHLVNGGELPDPEGNVWTWCGTPMKNGPAEVCQDRRTATKGALYADLCRRCFIQPRDKLERA